MAGNFASRDADVAAQSEKYERVENQGECSRDDHEEEICRISFFVVLGRDPAPVASGRDSVIWSFLWVGSDKMFDAQFE
jgi:hypothetical protein